MQGFRFPGRVIDAPRNRLQPQQPAKVYRDRFEMRLELATNEGSAQADEDNAADQGIQPHRIGVLEETEKRTLHTRRRHTPPCRECGQRE